MGFALTDVDVPRAQKPKLQRASGPAMWKPNLMSDTLCIHCFASALRSFLEHYLPLLARVGLQVPMSPDLPRNCKSRVELLSLCDLVR